MSKMYGEAFMKDKKLRQWCRNFDTGHTDVHKTEGQGKKRKSTDDLVQRVVLLQLFAAIHESSTVYFTHSSVNSSCTASFSMQISNDRTQFTFGGRLYFGTYLCVPYVLKNDNCGTTRSMNQLGTLRKTLRTGLANLPPKLFFSDQWDHEKKALEL